MRKSGLRTWVSVVVLILASIVVGNEVWERMGDDGATAEAPLRGIGSWWASRRRSSATELGNFAGRDGRIVPALIKALGDHDAQVRSNSLDSLRVMATRAGDAMPELLVMIKREPEVTVRRKVVQVLGALGNPQAVPALVKALDDLDPAVCVEAIRAVGNYGSAGSDAKLVERLIANLATDQPEDLRIASVEALESIAPGQEPVIEALAKATAKDPSAVVRDRAVAGLKKASVAVVIPTLIKALDDAAPQVRLAAASSLARIGLSDDRVVPALCNAVRAAEDVTREGMALSVSLLNLDPGEAETSAETLGRRYRQAVAELSGLLESRQVAGRAETLDVFGRLVASYQKTPRATMLEPARTAIDAIWKVVDDAKEDLPLRLHAINQWTTIRAPGASSGDPKAGEGLNAGAIWIVRMGRSLKSPVEAIRARAIEILLDASRQATAEGPLQDAWRKTLPDLVDAFGNDDRKLRGGAIAILANLGPEAGLAIPSLKALREQTTDADLRPAVDTAIRSISAPELLKDKDPKVRAAAATTLGELGWRSTTSVPALVEASKDPEADVRAAAIKALAALGGRAEAAVPILAEAIAHEPNAELRATMLNSMESIAPGSKITLAAHLRATSDPSPLVRKSAATFQNVPDNDPAVAALAEAIHDPDESVRISAATSLSRILYMNPAVLPSLFKAAADEKLRPAITNALALSTTQTPSSRDVRRVLADPARLRALVASAVPALREAQTIKDDEVRGMALQIVGRLVGFSRMSQDAEFRKSLDPAVDVLLEALKGDDTEIRVVAIEGLAGIPIRRGDVVEALLRLIGRADATQEDRAGVFKNFESQARAAQSDESLRFSMAPVIPILIQNLGERDETIRGSAVRALGYLGTDARVAEETIRRLADVDPVPAIRLDAENAAKAIEGTRKMPPPTPSRGMAPR